MKIGYDAKRAYHNPTGLGNYSRTLIGGMLKQHPENEYLLMDTGNPMDLPYFNRQLNDSGANWKYESGGMFGKHSRSYGWGSKARSLKLDVYHGLSNEIPLDWKPGATKSVVTIHDVIFKRYPEAYKALDRWFYNRKTQFACKKADIILATSLQTQSDLEEYYPDSRGRIQVVYQDADPAFHYRKRTEAVAKILYKFDIVERPYILCVSKLEKRKNHKVLLEAFRSVMSQIPEDLVLVGGRGDTGDEILEHLGDYDGRLRWLGNVETDDLVNLYDGASYTAYPSVFEGFGIPLLESMRRGKAIVSSTGSCFQEIAGQAALYADPTRPEEMAQQLLRLSTDAELKRSLETAGQTESKRFDMKVLVETIHGVYRDL
jgi:glycosyltransferase involved in cell wall biosynthesis